MTAEVMGPPSVGWAASSLSDNRPYVPGDQTIGSIEFGRP
jgi:hypothetical protein